MSGMDETEGSTVKPQKFLAGGSTSPQAGLSQQKDSVVTVPCTTQGNKRKAQVIKRNVPPQNSLYISPLAISLPNFSKCRGFQAEEIMSQSYLS